MGSREVLVAAKKAYEPITNEISYDTVVIQAAQTLDIAAQQAVECKDTESLLKISAMWMNLSEVLSGVHDDEPQTPQRPETVGFIHTDSKKEIEIVQDGE